MPEEFYDAVEQLLQARFIDRGLLAQALTHRSYANESGLDAAQTNERLEFLGDAVLDLIVSGFLFRNYPELAEGELTRARARLVNTTILAAVAARMGIGPFILLSRDEKADRGDEKPSILADTLEAVIGALYLDQGLASTQELVMRILGPELSDVISGATFSDPKTELQERAVQSHGEFPVYEIDVEGPPHSRVFHSRVYVGSILKGRGSGRSKKEAEQAAAAQALREMGRA